MFQWLVARMNQVLDAKLTSHFFIGILDTTGFEILDVSIRGKSKINEYFKEIRKFEFWRGTMGKHDQSMLRIIILNINGHANVDRGISWITYRVSFLDNNYRQLKTAQRRIHFSQGWVWYRLSIKPYTQEQQKQTLQIVIIHLCIHIHTYVFI